MTTVSLSGLDARYASIADELSKAQSIIEAEHPYDTSPSLAHIRNAGLKAMSMATDAAGIYGQYESTDRRAQEILSGQFGITLMRTYVAAMSFLRESVKYVPSDEENSLRARIDTLLWLSDTSSVKADMENLVLTQIAQERARQDKKHGEQTDVGDDVMIRVTMEEFGEVAHAMNERDDADMEKELIETAACIVKWLSVRYRNKREKELDTGYTGKANKPQSPYNPAYAMGDMA